MPGWLDDGEALAAAHRRSHAVAAAWRGGAAMRRLTAAFDTVDADDADAVAAAARMVLAKGDWIEALLAPLIAALHDDPAFELPLRIQRDGLRTGAVLLDHRAAVVTATLLSADGMASLPPAGTAVASGRLSVVRYHRAGGARLRRWRAAPPPAQFVAADEPPLVTLPDIILDDGAVVTIDGRVAATLLDGAASDVASITVSVRAGMAAVMRDYALPSGRLIRAAAIDDGMSRAAMLLTLLRVSGRADAGDAFDAASRAPAFHLRWQAMREWLATDVAGAMSRLADMAAADPHPEVRAAARLTLAQLAPRRAA